MSPEAAARLLPTSSRSTTTAACSMRDMQGMEEEGRGARRGRGWVWRGQQQTWLTGLDPRREALTTTPARSGTVSPLAPPAAH